MAVWDAASAAEVAPFASASVRDVDPVVRLYVFSRREFGVPGKLEGLDVFALFTLYFLLFLLLLTRRHARRSCPVQATGARCTR